MNAGKWVGHNQQKNPSLQFSILGYFIFAKKVENECYFDIEDVKTNFKMLSCEQILILMIPSIRHTFLISKMFWQI